MTDSGASRADAARIALDPATQDAERAEAVASLWGSSHDGGALSHADACEFLVPAPALSVLRPKQGPPEKPRTGDGLPTYGTDLRHIVNGCFTRRQWRMVDGANGGFWDRVEGAAAATPATLDGDGPLDREMATSILMTREAPMLFASDGRVHEALIRDGFSMALAAEVWPGMSPTRARSILYACGDRQDHRAWFLGVHSDACAWLRDLRFTDLAGYGDPWKSDRRDRAGELVIDFRVYMAWRTHLDGGAQGLPLVLRQTAEVHALALLFGRLVQLEVQDAHRVGRTPAGTIVELEERDRYERIMFEAVLPFFIRPLTRRAIGRRTGAGAADALLATSESLGMPAIEGVFDWQDSDRPGLD